jgi:hypothetical protein
VNIKDKLVAEFGETPIKILDQAMHFLWTFLALAPVLMMDSHIMGGMLSGLAFALPREFIDQWPIVHWKDTALDLIFFALGGAVIGGMI